MKNDNHSISPQHVYDVLIVGAGPVGLATALGLRQRGITNILVIDKTREFRKVGQRVDLLPNGLRAIKYIDSEAYEKIRENASQTFQSPNDQRLNPANGGKEQAVFPKSRWCSKNLNGDITRSFFTDFDSWYQRYGEGRVSISWFDLQTSLRSLLPSDRVQANHRCIHVEEEAAWVRIDTRSDTAIATNPFAHWEMMPSQIDPSASTADDPGRDQKSLYAKVVVAADGMNSTVRQVLYNHQGFKAWAHPQYSGFAGMSSRIVNLPTSLLEDLEARYIQGDRVITIHNNSDQLEVTDSKLLRLLLMRLPDHAVMYFLITPFRLEAWQNKSRPELLALGTAALKQAEFPSVFTDLIGLSNPDQLSHRPFYLHPVTTKTDSQPAWSKGRVVLIGDAAHGMPPFMAQGANQGLEDAATITTVLAKLVQDNALDLDRAIANAFERYEQIRRPFMEKVQSATMTCNQWTQKQWDDFNEILHRRDYPAAVTLAE